MKGRPGKLLDQVRAAVRPPNVPWFLRLPVFGFFFREYNLNSPDCSFLIIPT